MPALLEEKADHILHAYIVLCSIEIHSIMLYRSETCPVKEEDMIRLEMNDARIVRWMYNVRL